MSTPIKSNNNRDEQKSGVVFMFQRKKRIIMVLLVLAVVFIISIMRFNIYATDSERELTEMDFLKANGRDKIIGIVKDMLDTFN